MPDIVLATLNAKYIHTSFGLRYLMANLGELREHACIAEFDINQRPLDIVESILAREPRIVGLGVYIWNVAQTTEVVALLKRIRPELVIILGGPEVSYETDEQPIVTLADHVITGEADVKFTEVCALLLGTGERIPDTGKDEASDLSGIRYPKSGIAPVPQSKSAPASQPAPLTRHCGADTPSAHDDSPHSASVRGSTSRGARWIAEQFRRTCAGREKGVGRGRPRDARAVPCPLVLHVDAAQSVALDRGIRAHDQGRRRS